MSRLRRLRGASRFVGAGLLDQVVIAAANASNTLLGAWLLSLSQLGALVLALGVGYFAMYLNRAFVGDVLIALASRYDGERRDRLVRNGVATAALVGVASTVLFVLLWLVWPHGDKIDFRALIWLAPFMAAIMVHDTARCDYLAERQPEKALTIDLVWAGTQAVVVTVVVLLGSPTPAGLLAAWGVGATAGAAVYLVRRKRLPWQGRPRQWLAETRHLSGWFTATAVVGQVQVLAVSFLVAGRLSKAEVGGLRFVQTVQLQPVQNLITAVLGLLVPRVSRQAAAGDRAALQRQTLLLCAAFAVLGALMVLTVWPVLSHLLGESRKYGPFAPLALPIALQGAVYLLQVPFSAAMRGMHRARMLFVQYLVFSAVSLTGLVLGAGLGGLLGAVWGLFVGSATGLVCMIGLYWYALRWIGAPTQAPATVATPS